MTLVFRSGAPNFEILVENSACVTVSASIFSSGTASVHRVKRSKQIIQYLRPSETGSRPTISMCLCLNLENGGANRQESNCDALSWSFAGNTAVGPKSAVQLY